MLFYNGVYIVYNFTKNTLLRIALNVIICVFFGLVFYYADLLFRILYKKFFFVKKKKEPEIRIMK